LKKSSPYRHPAAYIPKPLDIGNGLGSLLSGLIDPILEEIQYS